MFRKHFTREVYKVCSSYWLWTNEITGYGLLYEVSDSHSSIWNKILADNEVQFVSQSASEQTFIGW